MELATALQGRRSVRAFHPDPVPRELTQNLVDAAAWAPSAVDSQALTYLIVEGRRRLDEMSLQIQAHALRHLPREQALESFRRLGGDDFHAFYRAPAVIIICAAASSPWAVEDACLAAQNLMLAAYRHQLGSCWIGFARDWLRSPEGLAAMEVSESLLPVAPIAIGWPKEWPSASSRREKKVRWIC